MTDTPASRIAIVGAGPAGLIAAEHLAARGHAVDVYDRMPTPGRKFLMAGRGGLNLTHSEESEHFLPRYREAVGWLAPRIHRFPPEALQAWADGLGQETFTGSSGRIFPRAMKASPLLRAWRARLEAAGVTFHLRHHWVGHDSDGALRFDTPDGLVTRACDALLLAVGGASWPRLGSDGGWSVRLREAGVDMHPFQASNTGVEIAWSVFVRDRFAGEPLKTITVTFREETVAGEAMISRYGLEGGAIYALSAPLREALATGPAAITLDLRPNLPAGILVQRFERAPASQSTANLLRKAGVSRAAAALMREVQPELPRDPEELTSLIKALPLTVTAQRGLDRAISSAGGIAREAIDERMMLSAMPGTFVAGEMIDWDAPTGGYLLQACFATGVAAAEGIDAWLGERRA